MVGYGLLVIGIIIIVLATLSVYGVFKGKATPVNIFNFNSITINSNQLVNVEIPGAKTQSSEIELLPASILNQTSNVFAHLILMGFMASIGYKIAALGVMMLRPVVVKLNEKKQVQTKTN